MIQKDLKDKYYVASVCQRLYNFLYLLFQLWKYQFDKSGIKHLFHNMLLGHCHNVRCFRINDITFLVPNFCFFTTRSKHFQIVYSFSLILFLVIWAVRFSCDQNFGFFHTLYFSCRFTLNKPNSNAF